jgi:hypothetical protein
MLQSPRWTFLREGKREEVVQAMSLASIRIRWSGLAPMLGGLQFIASTVIYFVFTHGSSTENARHGTLVGLDAADYGRLDVIWPLLLMLGLAAFHERQARDLGRWGRMGFITAMIALAALALSAVLQFWIVDWEADLESIPVNLGFFLGLLSNVILSVAMIVFGLATVRAGVRPLWRALPLAIGLLGAASVLVELFVLSGLSIYGLTRDLVYVANRVPWGLGWVLLGYALWKGKA